MRFALPIALMGCGAPPDSAGWVDSGAGATGSPATGSPATGSPGGTPTGATTAGFTPTHYTVAYAWFGVRGGLPDALDDVDLFGTPIATPIQLAVRLGDDSALDGPTPDNHCDVVLTTYDPQPRASWEGAEGAWFAVELPGDAAISDANCDTLERSTGWSDPAGLVGAHRWGVAVTDLAAADLDALGGTTASTFAPAWVGGRWWTDAEPGGARGPGVATANRIEAGWIARDADHDLLPLDAATVRSAGGVTDGFYVVTPLNAWRPLPAGFGAP